ncbi:hypothetical protein D3C76_420370 [compost metagenome]
MLPTGHLSCNSTQLEAVTHRSTEPARTVLIVGTVCTSGRRGVIDLNALLPQVGVSHIDRDILCRSPASTEADHLPVARRNARSTIDVIGG